MRKMTDETYAYDIASRIVNGDKLARKSVYERIGKSRANRVERLVRRELDRLGFKDNPMTLSKSFRRKKLGKQHLSMCSDFKKHKTFAKHLSLCRDFNRKRRRNGRRRTRSMKITSTRGYRAARHGKFSVVYQSSGVRTRKFFDTKKMAQKFVTSYRKHLAYKK